ncbi:hypothetical protein SRM_00730 [Salinibacter ruber M8]|uniref:Uncharacterized protein n=2 Tax=Salinibacter ruber TaxID=146919 RepID=D5H6J6_SALRM|nr:hypothetical protein SRM_00730 [Salinibacter ruber M8]
MRRHRQVSVVLEGLGSELWEALKDSSETGREDDAECEFRGSAGMSVHDRNPSNERPICTRNRTSNRPKNAMLQQPMSRSEPWIPSDRLDDCVLVRGSHGEHILVDLEKRRCMNIKDYEFAGNPVSRREIEERAQMAPMSAEDIRDYQEKFDLHPIEEIDVPERYNTTEAEVNGTTTTRNRRSKVTNRHPGLVAALMEHFSMSRSETYNLGIKALAERVGLTLEERA